MRRNEFASPEQLAMLAKALEELGSHLPPGDPERDNLAAQIMSLFENGANTLEDIKQALGQADRSS